MSNRPTLCKEIDPSIFHSYYYLKSELVDFCRALGIPAAGGKIELTERIAYYLDTGKILSRNSALKNKKDIGVITGGTLIEANFVCSEKHRAYFKQKIGCTFSFNVAFQKWLKTNTGKTYRQAIEAYDQILEEKKKGKTTIDKQFEYNAYIRDFFANNKGMTLEDAIKCWKYKKNLQGHNLYENEDLGVL